MNDDPYAEFREGPGDNLKKLLRSLADDLQEANAEVDRLNEALITANNVVRDITEKRIPEATEGMDGKLDLGDGRTLELKEKIRASIAGEKRQPAIDWLDSHDYGHIVKRQIIIELGKNDDRHAKVLEMLRDMQGVIGNFVVKTNYNVHPQTLEAWVREMFKEGVDLPAETFGIYRQRIAKIKE